MCEAREQKRVVSIIIMNKCFLACWSLSSSVLIFLMGVWQRRMLKSTGNKEYGRCNREREKKKSDKQQRWIEMY